MVSWPAAPYTIVRMVEGGWIWKASRVEFWITMNPSNPSAHPSAHPSPAGQGSSKKPDFVPSNPFLPWLQTSLAPRAKRTHIERRRASACACACAWKSGSWFLFLSGPTARQALRGRGRVALRGIDD
ncbi:hypothetical protein G7Y89_g15084 [Cudoniella acicularis]|uniref:Uncharacterized protein n=1 Tax=Cudoniella acicularis TaxID=354080 RepID=A0A8H4QUS0_9HELO|nr:hypothetical protein G7Y89_g15084 [Cudoniella acicularis]